MRNQVRQYRLSAELTQQQLADEIGATRQTLSLIEKGEYNPSLRLCLAICWTLNMTLDELFWTEEDDFNE